MNNKIILLTLIALVAISCNKEKPNEFSSESFTEKELSICKNETCPEITINYLQAFGNGKVSEKINKKIDDFILRSLSVADDTIPTARTIQEAAKNFIDSYNTDKAQFPDMAGKYVAEISVSEIYASAEHLCFEMRQYLYTGGAHGYSTTAFMNIDPKTGEELTTNDIFKNKKDFSAFAEKKFRKQQNIPLDEPINATGLWFEDEKFHLPESVGFTKDSLIFVYNQYDIASYAEGPIELKIALKDAEPFLNVH